MKKFSLFVALALIVTVGGVYATWNYAETPITQVDHNLKGLSITDVNTTTQSGKVAITDTLILKIDDEGNYTPGWDSDVTTQNGGTLQIRYTPNQGAGNTTLRYTLTIENYSYDPDGEGANPAVSIFGINDDFSVKTGAQTILTKDFNFTAGQAYITEDITLKQITDVLKVNSSITLPTESDYIKYQNAVKGVKLVLTITEVE